MAHKVYLAKLKRTDGWPKCVYKVGITGFSDAMDRLTYRGKDEENPIIDSFPDIKVMNSIWCEDEYKAKQIEAEIMTAIQGSEGWFHNWFEERNISGITEMRKWNYEEVQEIFKIMKRYK